jgi:hypothetical protein
VINGTETGSFDIWAGDFVWIMNCRGAAPHGAASFFASGELPLNSVLW